MKRMAKIFPILIILTVTILMITPSVMATTLIVTQNDATTSECHIIYDAGSSGTRLYVYEQQGESWLEHKGPEASALADPIREIRGKSKNDVNDVVSEVVYLLKRIKIDGPVKIDESDKKKEKPEWKAFDWENKCTLLSVRVYATAGMRIAEQENRNESSKLWNTLNKALKSELDASVTVETRTITGYEEGLYAWLAVREATNNNNFGIVEMGGASSQITFPCPDCKDAENIIVKGKPLSVYSYSFLGLGQDEAPKTLGFSPACGYGIGLQYKNWKTTDCSDRIELKTVKGMPDPYNMGTNAPGTYKEIPISKAKLSKWYLTGAFNYMKDSDISDCCLEKGAEKKGEEEEEKCHGKENSCFQPVYMEKYLSVLAISATNSEKSGVSWSQGAVICIADNCLKDSERLQCRWAQEGCL